MGEGAFVMAEEAVERIGAAPAIGMALMERLGIVEYLDGLSGSRSGFPLGKRVKAMCGTMFTPNQRQVLSAIGPFYGYAPVGSLFGVGHASMNDQSFGRALDEIWELDPVSVFYNVASRVRANLHTVSAFYHFDASNMTVYRVPGSEPDPAVPEDGPEAAFGRPKDHSTGLMQYNFESVVDENGLPLYTRLHRGNESDGRMLMDALRFLEERMREMDFVAVADCKMVYAEMVDRLIWDNVPFISKCPASFGDSARDRAVTTALERGFTRVGRIGSRRDSPEFEACDMRLDAAGTPLRFIAFREVGVEHTFDYYRGTVAKRVARTLKALAKREFDCRPDAESALAGALSDISDAPFAVTSEVFPEEVPLPLPHRGRPRKGEVRVTRTVWRVRVGWEFDEAAAGARAVRDDVRVIVTSVPDAPETCEDFSDGATCADVMRAYFGQWRVEDVFRDFKSRLGADTVYLQNAHREAAFVTVVAVATLVRNVMRLLLRRAEGGVIGLPKGLTPMRVFRSVQNSDIRAGRDANHPVLDGPPHERDLVVMVAKALELDPAGMLG